MYSRTFNILHFIVRDKVHHGSKKFACFSKTKSVFFCICWIGMIGIWFIFVCIFKQFAYITLEWWQIELCFVLV